jgi:hypothetical protein
LRHRGRCGGRRVAMVLAGHWVPGRIGPSQSSTSPCYSPGRCLPASDRDG